MSRESEGNMQKVRTSIYFGNSFMRHRRKGFLFGVTWPLGWMYFGEKSLKMGYLLRSEEVKYREMTHAQSEVDGYIHVKCKNTADNFAFAGPSADVILDNLRKKNVGIIEQDKALRKNNVILCGLLAFAISFLIFFGYKFVTGGLV